jgi:hypothetical protein
VQRPARAADARRSPQGDKCGRGDSPGNVNGVYSGKVITHSGKCRFGDQFQSEQVITLHRIR